MFTPNSGSLPEAATVVTRGLSRGTTRCDWSSRFSFSLDPRGISVSFREFHWIFEAACAMGRFVVRPPQSRWYSHRFVPPKHQSQSQSHKAQGVWRRSEINSYNLHPQLRALCVALDIGVLSGHVDQVRSVDVVRASFEYARGPSFFIPALVPWSPSWKPRLTSLL